MKLLIATGNQYKYENMKRRLQGFKDIEVNSTKTDNYRLIKAKK